MTPAKSTSMTESVNKKWTTQTFITKWMSMPWKDPNSKSKCSSNLKISISANNLMSWSKNKLLVHTVMEPVRRIPTTSSHANNVVVKEESRGGLISVEVITTCSLKHVPGARERGRSSAGNVTFASRRKSFQASNSSLWKLSQALPATLSSGTRTWVTKGCSEPLQISFSNWSRSRTRLSKESKTIFVPTST